MATKSRLHRAKTAVLTSVLIAAGSVASAQDGPKDELREPYINALKGKTVAFVPTSMGFDLTEGWAEYIGKDAAANGYNLVVTDPAFDTNKGTQILSSLIADKPDVMVVHNIDVQSYARLLKKAEKEGIKVIQVNMKSTYSTDAYVGADWFDVGARGAEYLAKSCSPENGKSGKIAIVQGALTAAASVYQIRGVEAVLKDHPDIQIVANQPADWDSSKAQTITSTILQQHPDICGFFGFWDWMDIGIGAAVKEAGKLDDVEIVTSGAGNILDCEKLEEGTFDYVINYDVPGQSRDITNLIKQYLQTDSPAGANKHALYTPLQLMTKGNYADYGCWELSKK